MQQEPACRPSKCGRLLVALAVLVFIYYVHYHRAPVKISRIVIDPPRESHVSDNPLPAKRNVFTGDGEYCRLVWLKPDYWSKQWSRPRNHWQHLSPLHDFDFLRHFEEDVLYCLDDVFQWLHKSLAADHARDANVLAYRALASLVEKQFLTELWLQHHQNLLPSMSAREVEDVVASGASVDSVDGEDYLVALAAVGPSAAGLIEASLARRINETAESPKERGLALSECVYYLRACDFLAPVYRFTELFRLLVENGHLCYARSPLADFPSFRARMWLGVAVRLMREDYAALVDNKATLVERVAHLPAVYETRLVRSLAVSYVYSAETHHVAESGLTKQTMLPAVGRLEAYYAFNPRHRLSEHCALHPWEKRCQ